MNENTSKKYKPLPPVISRVGSKRLMRSRLYPLFPPHSIYVEPFVGGGSVLFGKPPTETEIINDLDRDIINIYKDIRRVGADTIRDFKFPCGKSTFTKIKNSSPSNPRDRLYRNLYLSTRSFGSNRQSYMGTSCIPSERTANRVRQDITRYKERLSNVLMLNKDFASVIQDYDSKDTFFYLDPPYSQSDPTWGYKHMVDPADVLRAVNGIKGKFLLSYDDSPIVRSTFKKYNIKRIQTRYSLGKSRGVKKELLISNYN